MPVSSTQAEQIAYLLNNRNELTRPYTRALVLEHADNYVCRCSENGSVIACVEVKKVQWYQTEVLHLTVAEPEVGKGHAKALLADAERVARANNARILQCTIREGNDASRGLFEKAGYALTGTFINVLSGNRVGIFQKILAVGQNSSG